MPREHSYAIGAFGLCSYADDRSGQLARQGQQQCACPAPLVDGDAELRTCFFCGKAVDRRHRRVAPTPGSR